ncbi:MAG TPA: hypothetical protein VFV38_04380 [Ktedonobacteraceae bacterium]|nr:hypothetical protein [Ktedonobacteraceae bacterium]
MGCIRLGYSLVISLLGAAIFTVVGTFMGTIIPLVISSHGSNLLESGNSPLDILAANPTGALIGGGIGALIGLYGVTRAVKRASNITWLKKHGRRITATVTEIQTKRESRQVPYSTGEGMQYRTEMQTFYVVVAQWVHPQTRQPYTFRSERHARYPKHCTPGSGISVLIDPATPQRFLVEV